MTSRTSWSPQRWRDHGGPHRGSRAPRALSSPSARDARAVADAEAREFTCARCTATVRICRRCDRGNRYCPLCAPLAERERVQRAGVNYQGQEPGRTNHKRRQQEYLARCEAREKMTHRGSAGLGAAGDSPPRPADAAGMRVTADPDPAPPRRGRSRCDFCGREIRVAIRGRVAARRWRRRRGARLPQGGARPPRHRRRRGA